MSTKKFKKILIANRGEIALRVIRTCRELGIQTVAVYSTADKDSRHVAMADESVCVGPPMGRDSYLNIQNIIAAAEITGADAVHPGYGFLSERADFVEILESCEIAFIGPSPGIIAKMGDKSEARRWMMKHNIPTVPGSEGVIKDPREGLKIARECGFPVMVKATAGGGGRGMRLIECEEDFLSSFDVASNEALSAFGNGDLYIEKFVVEPRHIEVQILADKHGSVIHLGERNCSVQRRNQKLIEEAPSPGISEELRQRICDAGVNVARSIGYENAGTVEFLVDKDENFYFMEMNTRLQVEHPVTEMVTGIDLVEEQIRIAEGERLRYRQEDIHTRGHSVEFRINAEDPENDFMPSPGKVEGLFLPGGLGVRVDTFIGAGDTVLPHYDSMIAKLIVWAKDRESALEKGCRALQELFIEGVDSTRSLHLEVLSSPRFREGIFSTKFLDTEVLAKRRKV